MSASRRRVTGITLPCAASFKNSSGVGEYMKSFLAEARRKQKQEAKKPDGIQFNFVWFYIFEIFPSVEIAPLLQLKNLPKLKCEARHPEHVLHVATVSM